MQMIDRLSLQSESVVIQCDCCCISLLSCAGDIGGGGERAGDGKKTKEAAESRPLKLLDTDGELNTSGVRRSPPLPAPLLLKLTTLCSMCIRSINRAIRQSRVSIPVTPKPVDRLINQTPITFHFLAVDVDGDGDGLEFWATARRSSSLILATIAFLRSAAKAMTAAAFFLLLVVVSGTAAAAHSLSEKDSDDSDSDDSGSSSMMGRTLHAD